MRVLLQRVSHASVEVDEQIVGKIDQGFLVFLGIEEDDDQVDIDYLVKKISGMRVFADNEGKMNLDIKQKEGKILCVSQFTLHASTRKGNRPSFIRAASPEKAEELYQNFLKTLREQGLEVESGIFGAHMKVDLLNDGPVTIWLDSKEKEY